jgi:hypothetical protein
LRAIRELERVAYSEVRDVVQWNREPALDSDGDVIGFKDNMTVTPSHLLTREHTARIRSVTTKSGALKFDTYDKLGALTRLKRRGHYGRELLLTNPERPFEVGPTNGW